MAAERLRAGGERRVGLVFVVGEERGSDGARAANLHRLAERMPVPGERRTHRWASCNGHPRHPPRAALCQRTRGAFVAARSGRVGDRQAARRARSDFARRSCPTIRCSAAPTIPIGLISGGIAPNVVSPHAEAEVMFRTVGSAGRPGAGARGHPRPRPHHARARRAGRAPHHARAASKWPRSPSLPTSRFSIAGDSHCWSVQGRCCSRIPTTSTSGSRNWSRRWTPTRRWQAACSLDDVRQPLSHEEHRGRTEIDLGMAGCTPAPRCDQEN